MAMGGAERKAINKALAMGGAAAVTRLAYGRYAVASATRPGTAHRVAHPAGRPELLRCSCEAGVSGRVCWHVAATWIAKVEAGGGRVTGPAAGAAELPENVVAFAKRAA